MHKIWSHMLQIVSNIRMYRVITLVNLRYSLT